MKKSYKPIVAILAYSFSVLINIGFANDKNEITWYRPDFPPANFVSGLMEGLGYNDQTQKFLTQNLSQYQHHNAVASYKRVLHNLRFGNGCVIGLFKTQERQKYLTFSTPNLITFPNGIVFKEDDLMKFKPYINKDEFISIKKLLKNQSLVVGIADGRNYSGGINKYLFLYQHQSNIHLRSGTNVFTDLLNMLDRNRIDYLFGFPEELEYYSSLGVLQHKMRFVPVQEMPQYEQSYIACSKNIWGEKVIDDINILLAKYRSTSEYLRFYEFWLDFDSKRRHHQLSKEVFNEKTNQSH